MAQPIVQITFKLQVDAGTYRDIATAAAETIASIEGLRGKIWMLNETEHEAGGVSLFNDAATARAYLESPLIANLKQAPFLADSPLGSSASSRIVRRRRTDHSALK